MDTKNTPATADNKKNLTAVKPEETPNKPEANKPETPATDKKAVLVEKDVKPEPPKKVYTVAERLAKLEELNELAERRELLIESREKLKAFYISENTGAASLKLTDSKANSFTINHPEIIKQMVEMAKNKLTAEIEEIENKLNFTF